jgi:cytochrome c oxidase subunit II
MVQWGIGMQDPVTTVAQKIHDVHHLVFIIICGIVAIVTALLLYVMIRFRASKNPVPSKTSHNTLIEIIWTGIPVLILIVIMIPSFRLLYYSDTVPNPDVTIKVTGHQWYWTFGYPDNGGFTFDSYMVPLDKVDATKGQLRTLDVDNRVVIPVNSVVRFQVTSDDVIHSFAVPAFGIKRDAIPGHLSETWAKVTKEGIYYGQCSQICGVNHAYMPVAIEVVSQEKFAQWVLSKGGKMPTAPLEPAVLKEVK